MAFESILEILPPDLRRNMQEIDFYEVQELRLRSGYPLGIKRVGARKSILDTADVVRAADVEAVVRAATGQSAYSAQETLRAGYLPLRGGHRIGICGTTVQRNGEIYSMKDVTSLNIRVAHDVWIEPARLQPRLRENLLIIGAPGSGKTTLLRACIRTLSQMGRCVSVVDERDEVGAFDLGMHVDVLRGCGKQTGMELLLRSMGPEWIAVDEISAEADVLALEKCSYCGVKLLATAHAENVDELRSRRLYRMLLETGVFRRALVLRADQQFAEEEITI